MKCKPLTERKLPLPKGQEVISSVEISGSPFDEDFTLVLDFITDPGGETLVRVAESQGPRAKAHTWSVQAIQNRDAKGLQGFTDYAKTLGFESKTPGAVLANLIEDKYRKIGV